MSGIRTLVGTRSVTASPLSGTVADDYQITAPLSGWTGSSKPPPLIFCHGAGVRRSFWITDPAFPYMQALIRELAKNFVVYASDLGGDWWGSADHTARIEEARTYLNTTMGTSGPVTLVGLSMGGLGALNYARANPGNVRGLSLLYPVLNVAQFKIDNPSNVASLDSAYPGGYTDGLYGANCSPAVYGNALTPSIPVNICYSSADTVVAPATVTAFRAARPTTRIEMVGTQGHTDGSVGDALTSLVSFARVLA